MPKNVCHNRLTNVAMTHDHLAFGWRPKCKDCLSFFVLALLTLSATQSWAQRAIRHYRHSATQPPGAVGRDMLTRGGPLNGYFQPVELFGPEGLKVSLVVDGQFQPPVESPITVGMLIGQVYRLKVTGIPESEGFEVFPTIEVVNRLYPPPGQKPRYPIPIHLTKEELTRAINGQFVTRVVYLEDPNTALPRQEVPGFQRYFEVEPSQDPLLVADDLGRPMAILRIGSRIPDELLGDGFIYNSPPLTKYKNPGHKLVPQELKSVEPGPNADPRGVPQPTGSVRAISFVPTDKEKASEKEDLEVELELAYDMKGPRRALPRPISPWNRGNQSESPAAKDKPAEFPSRLFEFREGNSE